MRYHPAHVLLFLAALCCVPVAAKAQTPRWESGVVLGGAFYSGDISGSSLPYLPETRFAGGLFFRRYFTSRWSVRVSATFGELSNSDLNYTFPAWRSDRAFSFSTKFVEGALLAEWSPWSTEGNHSPIQPYLFAGTGILYYDPRPDFERCKLEDLAAGIAADKLALHSETKFVLPFGGGIRWHANKKWYLGIEGSIRLPFTDRLDGIQHSANSSSNDGYAFGNLLIGVRLGRENVKAAIAGKGRLKRKLPDGDGDGVADEDDNCPTEVGLTKFRGCPDSDSDGIPDAYDRCPDAPGLASRKGCPVTDSDKDGVEDALDLCPDYPGLPEFKGCSNDMDRDGDGVPDYQDRCLNEFGVIVLKGCPDADNDGIADADDACPLVFGAFANKGCPLELTTEQEVAWISDRALLFEEGSTVVKDPSILDQIALFLIKNPDYRLLLEGHADPTETAAMHISQSRADACLRYLEEQGVSSSRLRSKGYGGSVLPPSDGSGLIPSNRKVKFVLNTRG
ncbi:MAG: OmpA family protein [Saprospiraceae bacterium]|nr:OmpA family protein [Saprospiraceae bacterium]